MSNDENMEEAPETPYSQESTTLPSEASVEEEEEDGQLTTKKPAEEREVIVIKPSEVEYKKSNRMEYSSLKNKIKITKKEKEKENNQLLLSKPKKQDNHSQR